MKNILNTGVFHGTANTGDSSKAIGQIDKNDVLDSDFAVSELLVNLRIYNDLLGQKGDLGLRDILAINNLVMSEKDIITVLNKNLFFLSELFLKKPKKLYLQIIRSKKVFFYLQTK